MIIWTVDRVVVVSVSLIIIRVAATKQLFEKRPLWGGTFGIRSADTGPGNERKCVRYAQKKKHLDIESPYPMSDVDLDVLADKGGLDGGLRTAPVVVHSLALSINPL